MNYSNNNQEYRTENYHAKNTVKYEKRREAGCYRGCNPCIGCRG